MSACQVIVDYPQHDGAAHLLLTLEKIGARHPQRAQYSGVERPVREMLLGCGDETAAHIADAIAFGRVLIQPEKACQRDQPGSFLKRLANCAFEQTFTLFNVTGWLVIDDLAFN